jgi:hypothetical protein
VIHSEIPLFPHCGLTARVATPRQSRCCRVERAKSSLACQRIERNTSRAGNEHLPGAVVEVDSPPRRRRRCLVMDGLDGRLAAMRRSVLRGLYSSTEDNMQERNRLRATVVALVGGVMLIGVGAAYAQTHGMNRRDDRRDDRSGARAAKQACKAGDENSRAECRQEKRGTKQEGRHDGGGDPAPAAPAAPANPGQ